MNSADFEDVPDGGRAAVEGLGPRRAVSGLVGEPADVPAAAMPAVCPDDLPDGLIIADQAARVVVFNRAAARLVGIPPATAIGADVRDLLPLRDAEGRNWWTCTNPYDGLSTRTRHPEMSLYLADGTELLVAVGYVRAARRALPAAGQRGAPGAVQRLVITIRSAHQRARLERSRADLVSTVAHELRSPLTSVKGFTATLLAKWSRFTDDQKRVMLETVNADADRVTRLITELLDVSRIESGRMEIHRQVVDIPQQVNKIVAGRIAAGDPPERFKVEVTGDLPETWLDADKLDQILGNLIENAIRHGAGTVTVVVEPVQSVPPRVAAAGAAHRRAAVSPWPAVPTRGGDPPESPGDAGAAHRRAAVSPWPAVPGRIGDVPGCARAAAVSVRDEGPGVPQELVPRIFRQFWRAKRRGGAGLGLFIVKGLVEAHGGTITVQRAPGGGAEFRFTVPAGLPE